MVAVMGRPAVFLFWIIFLWSRLALSFGTESSILVSVEGIFRSGIYIYQGDSTSVTKTSPYNFTYVGSSNVQIRSLDVNVADGSIYFFERISRCICRFHSGIVENVHCGISSSVFTSIAYDWVSGNMYWTDGFFNWIAVQPVNTTDKSMFRVIIQDDIEKPRALAVDATAEYIFWFDISPSGYRIERSLLDGTSRTPIITTSLLSVEDIEIDAVGRRLYWTDQSRYAIETSLYDGTNRKVLYKELNAKFRSITVDTTRVCTTLYSNQAWFCFSKSTGSITFSRSSGFSFLMNPVIITMFKEDLRPRMTGGCSTLGCEHFCVNLQPSGKCMCKEGYTLNTDGLHCTENHPLYSKAFVVSNSTNICMLSFRATTGYNDPLRCVGNVVQGCQFLTVDTGNKLIYYVDTTSNFIREYSMATDTTRQITTASTVSGMVFDWTDGNLYWSETTNGKVKYVTIATLAARELVDVSSPPSHLTIDPHTRTLFWVEGTTGYEMRIVSMSLASREKSVILTHPSPAFIKDIFFDVPSDRLYFVQHSTLSSIQRNGSDIEYVYAGVPPSVDNLIIYKRYAIWSTTTSSNLNSLSLQPKTLRLTNLTNSMGLITGLAVYDESLQRQSKGPCSHLNGGCEQLCTKGASGTAVCACSYGLNLHSDGKSCTSVPQSSNFLLASDFNHGKLFQISTTDARTTALDINAVERPTDAVFDQKTSFIFWSERNDGTIRKSTINGSNSETIYTPQGFDSYINALAMDHSSGILYYAVSGESGTTSPGNIGVFKPSVGLAKTLVEGLSNIEGLALYPSKGLMFFTHQDEDDTFVNIVRASMDGTSSSVIISLDTDEFLTDLAIDYTTDRLYWSSIYEGVERSSLSGSGRTKFNTPFTRVRSIDIAGGFIYLSSERKHKVVKMNLLSGIEVSFMADNAELGFLTKVHVYPGQAQPASSVCANNNGGCSTFCLPSSSPSSSYCACQDGTDLKSDDPYTCQGVTRCPSAIANGRFDNPCTRNAGEVCTFQCNTSYTSTLASNTLTCGQDGQWNENLQMLCQATRSCPTILPNGQFDNMCTYNTAEVCAFQCNSGFTRTVASNTLTCGQDGQWNENLQLLCQVTQCPSAIPYGRFDDPCTRNAGEVCTFQCSLGYTSTVASNRLSCGQNGQWNENLQLLCQVTRCPSAITNGRFDNPCTRNAAAMCTFQCSLGYTSKVASNTLTCGQNGQWNENLQLLCQVTVLCPSVVSNGQFGDMCTYNAAEVCTFQCDKGYTSTVASNAITCGQDGQWNKNLQLLCQAGASTMDDNQQTMIYVGAVLAALVILSLTVVTIVCVVVKRRRRLPSVNGTRSEPNVYYTPNQPVAHQQGNLASGVVNQGMYDVDCTSIKKTGSPPNMAVPTPPYSVRPDSTYDTIPENQNVYSDPAPPYEQLSTVHQGPSLRSEALIFSAQSGSGDYLTLIRDS